jgi:predicted DCC family thiol-disulfide oxidoreductase YuxK
MVDELAVRRRLRRGSSPRQAFWVAFAGAHLLTRPLTVSIEKGKEALAVFSHREEAEMFLWWFETAGRVWQAREIPLREVVLMLYGPYRRVHAVVLDPLPQMLTDGTLDLVALERRRFVRWATSRERDPTLPDAD